MGKLSKGNQRECWIMVRIVESFEIQISEQQFEIHHPSIDRIYRTGRYCWNNTCLYSLCAR